MPKKLTIQIDAPDGTLKQEILQMAGSFVLDVNVNSNTGSGTVTTSAGNITYSYSYTE